MRDKYKQMLQEYECFRKHLESENLRSLLDQPSLAKLQFENVYQELQRKIRIKENLLEEKKKIEETISQIK